MASTNGLPVPALSSANNPPADFLALANAVDAAYGGSVANWAALPATGNFAGKRLWVSDIKVFASWNGTGWVQALPVSSTGISAADKASTVDSLGVGLVNVVPASVAQAGGSASANAQGLVTFTGVTSVSFNGVFSSTYKNYRVIITISSGTATGIANFRFRASGVDTATGYYQGDIALRTNGATANNSGENITAMYAVYFGTTANSNLSGSFDVYSPNLAARSSIVGLSHGTDSSSLLTRVTGTSVNNTTVYDGFSLVANTGSMTGSVQVFGYND